MPLTTEQYALIDEVTGPMDVWPAEATRSLLKWVCDTDQLPWFGTDKLLVVATPHRDAPWELHLTIRPGGLGQIAWTWSQFLRLVWPTWGRPALRARVTRRGWRTILAALGFRPRGEEMIWTP